MEKLVYTIDKVKGALLQTRKEDTMFVCESREVFEDLLIRFSKNQLELIQEDKLIKIGEKAVGFLPSQIQEVQGAYSLLNYYVTRSEKIINENEIVRLNDQFRGLNELYSEGYKVILSHINTTVYKYYVNRVYTPSGEMLCHFDTYEDPDEKPLSCLLFNSWKPLSKIPGLERRMHRASMHKYKEVFCEWKRKYPENYEEWRKKNNVPEDLTKNSDNILPKLFRILLRKYEDEYPEGYEKFKKDFSKNQDQGKVSNEFICKQVLKILFLSFILLIISIIYELLP